MPFDVTPLDPQVSAKINRDRLILALRDPSSDRRPWNFLEACSYAFHDAHLLGIHIEYDYISIGLSKGQGQVIFGVNSFHEWDNHYNCPKAAVTAVMVADALEHAPYDG